VILRRSTVLVALVAGLLVVGTGAAEGAWWPQRMLNLQRTLAADRVAPTKPSRLTVVATTQSSVTVSWRPSSDRVGVAGYIVYRDGVRVGSTASTRTRYVASSLTCGTSHRIAVQAYDLAGNRSARAVILAATSACVDNAPPSMPSNVVQTDVTSSSITVSWAASTDNFGVVGYEVLSDGVLAGSTASTVFALTALRCGAMYTIGVRALDAAGHRSDAASILVTTGGCPDTAAPSPPSALRVTSVNQSSVSVRWSAATDDRGVVGYSIYRSSTAVGSTGATSYTVGGLSCGASYAIAVDAYDAAGNRSGRSSLTATTAQCSAPPPAPPGDTTPPSVPSGLTVSGATGSTISLRWTASTDNTGVAGYGLYRDSAAAGSVSVPNATFSGLACGRSYDLAVDAYDANGNRSTRSTVVSSTAPCPDTTPPSAPSGLSQTGVTESTVGLTWTASSDNVGVAGYGIYLAGVRIATTSSPGYTFASLTCGTTYSAGVDAYDAAGGRSAVATLFVATAACSGDTEAPSAPQNQSISSVTESSFRMSWSSATDDVGVTGYAVYLDGAKVGTTTGTSYTYSGLTCGTTYTVGLEAFDAAGNTSDLTQATGPAATSACTPTADTQAPSSPGNLTLGAVSQTSLAVSWTASSDNVGVAGYGYYRGGSLVGNGAGTSYVFSALACGTGYSLAIDAYDAAGNRSGKTSLSATTNACSPPPPPPPPPPVPGGANLWVDTSGGSCARQATPGGYTDTQACSWNQAYQAAQTGDLILVRGGNYGNVKIGPNRTSIGAPGVTFRTASGENVVVNDLENGHIAGSPGGSNISFVGPASARTFRSDQASNIVVDGWNVDCNGCDSTQIFHLEAANNVTVRNSEIQDNQNDSLMWISGSNLTFENNKIHDAALPSGSGAHTECLYAWSVTNLTLKRNHFYHCSVMDVFITGGDVADGGFVENNVFEKPWESTGRISNSAFAFHFRNGGSPSPDPNDWDFRYNTFVGPLSVTTDENPVGPGGMRVTGNLFLAGSPCGHANATYSYNAFVSGGCGSNNIVNSAAVYLAGFLSVGDPGNFALLAASVLRDKGNPNNSPSVDRAGNSRPVGAAPDIGAYEFR
jgi:chitodextrinase